MSFYLPSLFLSMFLTIILIPLFRVVAVRKGIVDYPGGRKIHDRPVPKTGGLAMACGAFVPFLLWVPVSSFVGSVLVGMGILVCFGLVDDIIDLDYKMKFTGQVSAALVVICFGGVKISSIGMLLPGGWFIPQWVSSVVTVVVIVGVTNAINLSDGLDGLAGGISVLSFLCIAWLAYGSGDHVIALLALGATGAVFGFLRFNTYPAVVFMGDAGSQLLGFLTITLSIGLTQGSSAFSPLLPLLLAGFPILDTLFVSIERIVNGRSPFLADRNHLHHKLMGLGFLHSEAVFLIYGIQAFLVSSAYIFRYWSEWFILLYYGMFSLAASALFIYAARSGFRVESLAMPGRKLKTRLLLGISDHKLQELSFRGLQTGLPLMFFAAGFIPETLPRTMALICFVLSGILFLAICLRAKRLGMLIRMSLYLTVPVLIWLGAACPSSMMTLRLHNLYLGTLFALSFLLIITLRYVGKRSGFEINPLDFLILFIAVAVSALSGAGSSNPLPGLVAAKIIFFLFSFELFLGEAGDELNLHAAVTAGIFFVFGLRGWLA